MLMAFVVIRDHQVKRYIIDYRDQNDLILEAYNWCDVYAKINLNRSVNYNDSTKIVHIPPGFGIKIWNFFETLYYLIRNFFDAKIFRNNNHKNIHIRPKSWIRSYIHQFRRSPISNLVNNNPNKNNVDENYVFFASSYWKDSNATNQNRNQYIIACVENMNVNFEGGFFIHKSIDKSMINIPEELTYNTFLPPRKYINKIKRSIFVFNTPAVHDCHGWKLGEFLAMGKAIVTTPFYNELPFPLEHSNNVFIVNNEDEIKSAVQLLSNNTDLRKKLQKNARLYYDKYASPEKVIRRVLYK